MRALATPPHSSPRQQTLFFPCRYTLALDATSRAGTREHQIKCAFQCGPITSFQYKALSLLLGSSSVSPRTYAFKAKTSHHSALSHLHRQDTTRVMWIDQLFTNQDDNEEKGI